MYGYIMNKLHVTRTLSLIFLNFVILSSFISIAHAQELDKGFTVIPPKFELVANPGDTVVERIRVRNEASFPATHTVVIEDFSSSGEEGAVTLEDGNSSFSLASWIQTPTTQLVLQPGQEENFSFTIQVPKDAEPGGHYASILFQTGGPTTPGAASVTTRVGTLVLLRVSGNVNEAATISTFEAPKYSQQGPVNFTLRIQNDGNVHIRPKGTIIITDLFGRKVEEIPLDGANVLPGSVRKTDSTWEKTNIIGSYTATLVATYGQQNLPLTAATRFTVFSPTAAILIGVGGIALLFFIFSLITGRGRLMKAMSVIVRGH